MQMPPAINDVVISDESLGFHLEDGRFISVPLAFHPTLALATPDEGGCFEINGSSVLAVPQRVGGAGGDRVLGGGGHLRSGLAAFWAAMVAASVVIRP